jgi:oxygen-independent coproporphyrinogen III oxidase
MDLIFGLPARLGRDWGADLARTLALEPEHVSLYGLTAEPATPLGRWVREGRESAGGRGHVRRRVPAGRHTAGGARGTSHYEVSNFARPGRESRHNQAYWRHRPYVGLGPGAHSFLPPVGAGTCGTGPSTGAGWSPATHRGGARGGRRRAGRALERTGWDCGRGDGLQDHELGRAQRALVQGWVGWAGHAEHAEGRPLTPAGWLLDRLAVELDTRRS